MNSAVGPIFNEKIDKKMKFVDSWTVHGCTVHRRPVKSSAIVHVPYMNSTACWGKRHGKKKKKRENAET